MEQTGGWGYTWNGLSVSEYGGLIFGRFTVSCSKSSNLIEFMRESNRNLDIPPQAYPREFGF
jgi:hypothetical protein